MAGCGIAGLARPLIARVSSWPAVLLLRFSDRLGKGLRSSPRDALFASYGLFLAATEGVEKALVADLALAGEQGTAFAWFNLTTSLALLPASLLFGWLYETFSPEAAFKVAGGLALAAAGLMVGAPTTAAD